VVGDLAAVGIKAWDLTDVGAEARVASSVIKEESMKVNCHGKVSRGTRAAQLHR
jgi:hypothetical protein